MTTLERLQRALDGCHKKVNTLYINRKSADDLELEEREGAQHTIVHNRLFRTVVIADGQPEHFSKVDGYCNVLPASEESYDMPREFFVKIDGWLGLAHIGKEVGESFNKHKEELKVILDESGVKYDELTFGLVIDIGQEAFNIDTYNKVGKIQIPQHIKELLYEFKNGRLESVKSDIFDQK